jgi:glycosyltransferase involved in cell wall biosynthesis
MRLDLTVVILTFNEEIHIRRAIESVLPIAKEVIVVDSFSTDKTIEIATELGARTVQHKFVNQADQLQWALDNSTIQTSWVLRLDADEYLMPSLVSELTTDLHSVKDDVSGIVFKRRLHFMGKWIRYGGYYPVHLLRMWRHGHAVVEKRWMDEHMVLLQGNTVIFRHDFVDDNQQSLSWWTAKHNDYATREAAEYLNQKYNFMSPDVGGNDKKLAKQTGVKRWYKNNFYYKMPPLIRAFLYFQFRFWIRMGFLDGSKGLVWHFLQGFWYRFLVDAKILQIEWWAKKENKAVAEILREKFHFKLDK